MRRHRRRDGLAMTNGVLTLDAVERDSRVRVLRVTGRPLLIQRLAALGVVPGVAVTVLKSHSPAIVSIGGARIAIGQSAAQSVQVEMADE
ncbi:MAG: FeoA domain-containing protein [Actinomycetota bacterium]|nr:FeoA domain-containing protein [Actinomycetota bacterium]